MPNNKRYCIVERDLHALKMLLNGDKPSQHRVYEKRKRAGRLEFAFRIV